MEGVRQRHGCAYNIDMEGVRQRHDRDIRNGENHDKLGVHNEDDAQHIVGNSTNTAITNRKA